ncbi:DNA polymerase thumb domain-containing protein [Halobacillus litoralis]|uniref:UV damage repair protein UvrX n=1 Tax=Halobacillus litoralis TaxID=45668 RepID=A0A410MJC7_9BACI|nr:UV damage repair protein UvrX [Halobacillus litoralis]QAS54765.1 UV damage repair protein UvrX [Halobacillus litoralis]
MDYKGYPRNNVLMIDHRSFYASVEMSLRGLDPETTLLAVVGDPSRRGSVVLAASPALKKKHGVSNVSRYFELPNDPDIIIAPARMKTYLEVSVEITKTFHKYAPKEGIHLYSVDECWITLPPKGINTHEVAKSLKNDIRDQFGIESVVGIGDNKFLAKAVMDIHAKKSPDGIAECRYEDVQEKLWPTEISKVWGIGSRMTRNLNRMGIVTLGQIAKFPLKNLKKNFGVMGEQLYWHAWGIDLSPVYGDFVKTDQKSYGHGITLMRDYDKEDIYACILDLCEEACRRARRDDKEGMTIHLGIGYSRETGGGFSRSMSIDRPTNITMDVYKTCLMLFHRNYDGISKIRRAYVSLTNLDAEGAVQLNLFDDRPKKKDVGEVMDRIRNKYGSTAILRASSYTDGGITLERSHKVGGHNA